MSDKRIYVEQRDEGDWAVHRAGSTRASAVESPQAEAIARAKELETISRLMDLRRISKRGMKGAQEEDEKGVEYVLTLTPTVLLPRGDHGTGWLPISNACYISYIRTQWLHIKRT